MEIHNQLSKYQIWICTTFPMNFPNHLQFRKISNHKITNYLVTIQPVVLHCSFSPLSPCLINLILRHDSFPLLIYRRPMWLISIIGYHFDRTLCFLLELKDTISGSTEVHIIDLLRSNCGSSPMYKQFLYNQMTVSFPLIHTYIEEISQI